MTMRRLRSSCRLPLAASIFALACQSAPVTPDATSPDPAPIEASPPAPAQAALRCDAAPDWRPEPIDLPPEFAPSLPSGDELLWFAPGMFDPAAADYFSYVFELALDETPPSEPAELRALLHAYYAGLMQAVAKDSGRTPGQVVVQVDPTDEGHYVAAIEMTDEFTGGAPIAVTLELERTDTCIIAVVTPSNDDGVRAELARARTCLPCASVQ